MRAGAVFAWGSRGRKTIPFHIAKKSVTRYNFIRIIFRGGATIGLTDGASRAEIRHAYADLSKTYHVETHPEEFSRLHEAYQTALAAAGRAGRGQQDADANPFPKTGKGTDATVSRTKTEKKASTWDFGSVEAGNAGAAGSDTETGKKAGTTPADALLDRLLGKGFSIQSCSEPTQLLYYRCRYDETSSGIDALLLRITNAEQGIADEAHLHTTPETAPLPSNGRKFLGIRWKNWKTLDWTCIVCHPGFYRVKHTPAFLDELYRFLSEEMLNLRDGIRQELYFALCMAYGFFLPGKEREQELPGNSPLPKNSPLAKIENLLRFHPKHSEYQKDLKLWPDCKQARRIVLFCHEIYASLMPSGRPVPDQPVSGQPVLDQPISGQPVSNQPVSNQPVSGHSVSNQPVSGQPISGQPVSNQPVSNQPVSGHSASGTEKADGTADTGLQSPFPEAAAELLLDEEIPWKEFIYDRLMDVTCGSLWVQFNEKREAFQKLHHLQREFTEDFINLLDNHIAENYIYNDCYVPLATRLGRIKERYLTKPEWKKIICRPAFFTAFKEWLFPHHNGFSSVPCLMDYDTWKMLRACFEGSSDFEAECIRYLATQYYFPEYEKRYQRELIWENAHIEEAYFKETFPLPALSQGKLDLLDTIKNATSANMVETEKIFGNLTFDSAGLDFLTRITNAMTHFNFLLVTQKREKEAVPGDAFCFLEDEVLLYRKKENLLCRLAHPVFYDLISWKFEAAAYHVITGKPGYDEKFLDTACRNLYCYRHYAMRKADGCTASHSDFAE